ncbi:MAG: ABC transporter substrate-binding protein [Atopobiaceae bacterium]|jgi:polar amino acid transport system substrate-binding protein|nr:ABC transporter substrate-binding protein [Atopobiaceae bacterium]
MKRNNIAKLVAGVAAGVALVAALAGCGSTTTSGSSAPATTSASTGSYKLVESGKLTVMGNWYFPPFESMNESTGVAEGFDIDLANAIASKMGLTANILPSTQFDTLVPTIKQGGKADVSISGITITDERKKEIDFSDPYLDSNQSIVVKSGAAAQSIAALNVSGKKVAVQSGTTGESWAKENLPNATVVPLDDVIQAMTGVQTGLYDAVCADLPVTSYLIKNSYGDLVIPEGCQIATGEQYGVVVSKDNPALTTAINKALSDMKSDGTMDQLETKWFGKVL